MSWMNQPYGGGYGQQQYPQPTGYMPQQLQQQRTGFAPQPQFQQPQPTGFAGQGAMGGMRPPVPMQPQQTGFMGAPMQQRPMQTGYGGGAPAAPAPLVPQATGFNSSGLGAGVQNQFLQTFLPAAQSHPSAYMQPGQMQFAAQQHLQAQPTGVAPAPSLQQQFQQSNQQQVGQASVPIPWKLTPEEKKRYDQIFRAWDQQGSGFLPGSMAKEVFGQAGLQTDDLMAIWNLADVGDRGKLNIDEFHVAMGLIYRRLNGNPIPQTLPAEMAPPSARDLEDSASFLTSLLKNDTNRRATNQTDVDGPQSRAKLRSLHDSGPSGTSRKDATVYRNDDDAAPVYKSSSRHLNRDDVRSRGTDSPTSELDEAKRRLREAQREAERSREEDDDEEDLKEELRRLTRKIQRVQDDLDDNRRSGRRTAAKDEERRMLERELLRLEHDDLPRLEKRLEDKEREKRLDRKKLAIERDGRNGPASRRYEDKYDRERYGSSSSRYDDEDRSYSSSSRRRGGDGDDDEDRGYNRGTYDREDRSRYAPSPPRRQSPSARSRTPPPPPPAPSTAKVDAPPPPPPTAPPTAAAAPAAPDTRSMTPEQRQAFIRSEAQRRIQERLRALGVAAPSAAGANGVDTSVQDRLEADKLEAARKAAEADEQLKAKELERQAKLDRERAKGVAVEQALQDTQRESSVVQQVRDEVKRHARALPGQGNGAEPRGAVAAAEDQLDAEEKALRDREAQLERERDERRRRIEELEREAKEAEDNFARSKAAFQQASSKPKTAPPPPASRKPAPPPSRKAAPAPSPSRPQQDDDDFGAPPPRSSAASAAASPPAPPAPPIPSVAPPAPSATASTLSPPSSIASPQAKSPSTNPFFRLQGAAGASPAASPAQPGKPNPFFAAAGGAPPAAPPAPPAPVAPPAPKARAPPADDDDWDAPAGLEKDIDESDSDDEPIGGARAQRAALAQNLFSGLGMGGGRSSPAQNTTPPTRSAVSTPAPGAPPPPPPPPPAAPSAPSAPPAPKAPAVALGGAAGPADRGALLGAIQGGLRLRKAQTVDKSGPVGAGAVIGDASPPVQTYVPPPREPSPEPAAPEAEPEQYGTNGYGAEQDQGGESASAEAETLPAIVSEDPLANVDLSTTIRVRSLYDYEAQRPEDLGFPENRVLLAHPPRDGEGDWWYGATELDASTFGWFPKAYVEEIHAQPARALYAYEAASPDEHSFEEDSMLAVVDSSDASWWKAEKDGVVGLVPATYFDLSTRSPRAKEPVLAASSAVPIVLETPLSPVSPVSPTSPTDADLSDDDADSDDEAAVAAREAERLRVLQAAGLLVKPAARPGSPKRRRRPPPARPQRRPGSMAVTIEEQSSAAEEQEDEHGEREPELEEEKMEDAYDLYQRAMREQRTASLAPTVDSPAVPQPSPPTSPALSTAPSTTAAVKDAFQSSVSGFFSRRGRSATVGSEKVRPVISAPLAPQGDASQRDSRSSGAFGSTWASLVDQAALVDLPDSERKRQEACYELIATEQSYVQSLQLVIEVFLNALQPILPEKALQVIFANIDDILLFDTVFVSELEERQRQARLYIDTIGDVLKEHMRGVVRHYRLFCVNQSNAMRTLDDLKMSNAPVRETLDRLRVKNLELDHFLLEPMQRVTRYPLLVNQILRYTPPDHPDHPSLSRALELAEAALNDINEAVRAHENQEKLVWLSDNIEFPGIPGGHLDLSAPTRLLGPRRILREGKVEKAKSRRPLNAFLFNDLLVFTESRLGGGEVVYRYPIPLEESSVRGADSEFSVTHRGEAIRVRAETPRQAQAWVREVGAARRACLEAVKHF
ncbi:hypothetical protein JCM9279_003832 [Rhodotorula babjevae]